MAEAQQELYDEDVDELDWRIYAPRLRRLAIAICNEEWTTDQPRFWLMDGDEEGSPDADILRISVDRETFFAPKSWPAAPPPWPRVGTWQRYRADVAWAKALLECVAWTLTEEEQALMDALEAYGRQAPARHVRAA